MGEGGFDAGECGAAESLGAEALRRRCHGGDLGVVWPAAAGGEAPLPFGEAGLCFAGFWG